MKLPYGDIIAGSVDVRAMILAMKFFIDDRAPVRRDFMMRPSRKCDERLATKWAATWPSKCLGAESASIGAYRWRVIMKVKPRFRDLTKPKPDENEAA